MELLSKLDPYLAQGQIALDRLMAYDLPVPDAALIGAFAFVLIAASLSQRGKLQDARAEVEWLYQAELLTANRRLQQARDELRKARMEIERERQKRRRERGGTRETRKHPKPRAVAFNVTPKTADSPKPAVVNG